jgi:small subunit ribosomal protein S17
MERNSRRILNGEVVSASGDKTISVLVKSYKKHRLYGKRVLQTKKFAAHDEQNQCEVGDVVRIVETRPLSKTKRFRLLEVVEKKS